LLSGRRFSPFPNKFVISMSRLACGQFKGGINTTGNRALDGCPMFAPAYVGRKRRAKPIKRFSSINGTVAQ
jgi:hypothetical protein